jgi:hypothetical protein
MTLPGLWNRSGGRTPRPSVRFHRNKQRSVMLYVLAIVSFFMAVVTLWSVPRNKGYKRTGCTVAALCFLAVTAALLAKASGGLH